MRILLRILGMAWRYRGRLILAYLGLLAAISVSTTIPLLLGASINRLVRVEDGQIIPLDIEVSSLMWIALALLVVSLMRGFFDFGRLYATDSLAQKVAYDLRNQLYDKLHHLSFAYHDKEHTGDLMSKATADVEAVRRFVTMGLVRAVDVPIRVLAITGVLLYLNWELALVSLAFVPFLLAQSTMAVGKMRGLWMRVQRIMAQQVTILQENLSGIHVVKAFAAEEYESEKFAVKAQELRHEHFQSERLQRDQQRLDDPVLHPGPGAYHVVRRMGNHPGGPDARRPGHVCSLHGLPKLPHPPYGLHNQLLLEGHLIRGASVRGAGCAVPCGGEV